MRTGTFCPPRSKPPTVQDMSCPRSTASTESRRNLLARIGLSVKHGPLFDPCPPKAKVTRSNRVGCATISHDIPVANLPQPTLWRRPPSISRLSFREMPSQQGVQHIRGVAEACILQMFDRLVQPDETASGREVENAECSGDGEAPAPGNVDAVTVIDEQEVRPNLGREQDRSALALVQAQQFGIAVHLLRRHDFEPRRRCCDPPPHALWSFILSQFVLYSLRNEYPLEKGR